MKRTTGCDRGASESRMPHAIAAVTSAPKTSATTAIAADRRQPTRESRCTASASSASDRDSSSSRASPISRSRRLESRSRHLAINRRMRDGVAAGSFSSAGVSRITDASVSVTVSPPNAGRPVSISNSTQPNAQTSDRLSADRPFACSGAHVGRRAQNDADTGHHRRRCEGRGVREVLPSRSTGRFKRLRKAEVQHLHRTVRADFDVRRLEIAMDDPLLVRRFERFSNLLRDRERLVERNRPVPIRSASVGPSTSSITNARAPSDSSSP